MRGEGYSLSQLDLPAAIYNADFANNPRQSCTAGWSRCHRQETCSMANCQALPGRTQNLASAIAEKGLDAEAAVAQVRAHIEACQYNQALEKIWRQLLDPANQYADKQAPWKLVKTDKAAAGAVLFDLLEPLLCLTVILKLKPFALPRRRR